MFLYNFIFQEYRTFRLIYSANYLLIFRTLFLHNFASEKYEIQCKSENKIISTRKKTTIFIWYIRSITF